MSDRVRIAGYAGIVFVIAGVAQFFAAPAPPAPDASAAKIRAYLVDHRGGLLAQGFLQVIAVLFFLLFLVGLRELLRRSDDGAALSLVAVIGGVMFAALALVAQMLINAPVWVDGAAQVMSNDVLRFVWSSSYMVFGASSVGLVLLTGATAVAGSRDHLVPGAVVWVSAVAAVVGIAAFTVQFGSDFAVFGLLSFLALLLFALVVAGVMATGRVSEPAGAAANAVSV